jgi:hypothetical protein
MQICYPCLVKSILSIREQAVRISVTLTADNGVKIQGDKIFNIVSSEVALFQQSLCRMKTNLKKVVRHWEPVEDISALSFSRDDIQNFRKLSVELNYLADSLEKKLL